MNKACVAFWLMGLIFNVTALCQESRPAAAKSSQSAEKIYSVWPYDAKEAVRRQDETAKILGLKQELVLDLGGDVTMKLALIPAGKFVMGSPETEKDRLVFEGPQHPVTISKAYYIGVTEVTQGQYEAVMGKNPSSFKFPDNPVENVLWKEAAEFCENLSEKTKKKVRLPSEAEWEYACRAGTATLYSFRGNLADYAWFNDNAGKKTHPVGLKKPNPAGLYDMHGNVWEWCSDWYEEKYYANAKTVDPQGPDTGKKRSLRGGSWTARPQRCSTAVRGGGDPAERAKYIGFRVVVPAAGID
ncbi:MAG: formylglycine-generating enzyme family protein [Victivallales bacterium]|jgi:formylglycine-generating enzyme required for sulfatase activity